MFSTEDICKLLRSVPEAPEDVPEGLRTHHSFDELIDIAKEIRSRIVAEDEWAFDPLEGIVRIKAKLTYDFSGKAFTTSRRVVLKRYPQCRATRFDAVHELCHCWLFRYTSKHTEGDAHLAAAEVCFPHRFLTSKHARVITATNQMIPLDLLASMAERWIDHAQIPLLFPGEALHDPNLARRIKMAKKRQEARLLTSLHNDDDFDASGLLPYLTA